MTRMLLAAAVLLTACNGRPGDGGRAACGLAALAGPTALLTQFGVADQTLAVPPRNLPEHLVARIVAGPAYPAVVGRVDSSWVIGIEGRPPANVKPGFGVLVLDRSAKARGIMIYEGQPVEGAPRLGDVSMGSATLPLVGIQLDPARIEDPRCPFFPDSVLP